MKTVVITGGARGFGYEMAKCFIQKDYNVVICDINEESLKNAKKNLDVINSKVEVLSLNADITKIDDIENIVIKETLKKFNTIDIWINNAGVNQPDKPIWELDNNDINRLIDIDLKGTILCSKAVMKVMIKQNSGSIYNVEGYGSNDAKMLGLSIYGTCKRAITYFTEALANEVKLKRLNIYIGKITPGIMITNFIGTSLGDGDKINLPEKTKNIYNILGDYPETIASFMVNKIVNNGKNNIKFTWLTGRKAMWRFIKATFGVKNNFFKE